ncbi:IS110 family transposase [Candidatus Laterigemmans baculatus]|uniref:IS110 family transposase n=1 Tax=Candidatus Laterigemmans baculatus TaxID=2770505 RepID=UPI0013D95962|nr:transposase [Candidatus Laterigemmans baculatus]
MIKLYNKQHDFYCGVDLHAKTLHVCVVDQAGDKLLHRNFQRSKPEVLFANLNASSSKNIVVGCESTFNWYWLAKNLDGTSVEQDEILLPSCRSPSLLGCVRLRPFVVRPLHRRQRRLRGER